ncbi:metallopeptidase family protein [Isoptericola aurantiacus]|uniref:metallopeptidase family protein n=1 Tax=Isoptericola aurantiacus TaxID=3377839 RepID=UPI00383BCE4F
MNSVQPTGAGVPVPSASPSGPRRRDRRGRGIRGPLLPPDAPARRTRAEQFDDTVLGVVQRIERRWPAVSGTELAVEDVPPSDPAPWEDKGVPLGRLFPAEAGQPARIVVYRRPVESRALDGDDLVDLVNDVVVEQVAQLLARTPEEIDPDADRR